jgi:hypothetical protein
MTTCIDENTKKTSGSYKTGFDIKECSNFYLPPGKIPEDLFIMEYKPNEKLKNIYRELRFYRDFGNAGISPIIYLVKIKKPETPKEVLTLDDFFVKYPNERSLSPAEYSYLVEKNECSGLIISEYNKNNTLDISRLLRDFRNISQKIVDIGFVNTDVKLQNTCIDKNKVLKMIDFGPEFIMAIDKSIPKIYYVEYMTLQFFITLYNYIKKLGATLGSKVEDFFYKDDVLAMIKNMQLYLENMILANKNTTFNPLHMLMLYSENKSFFDYFYKNRYVFNVGTPDFWYDVIFKLRPTYELETELNTLITEDAERRLREEEQKRLEHQLRYLQRPSIVPLATEQTTSTNDVNEPTPESHQTLNNNGEHKGGTKNKGSEKKKKNKKTKQNQKKRKSRKMRK